MRTAKIERLAAMLADAWIRCGTIPLPSPADSPASRVEAFAVQDRMAELIGEPCVGWKVGATAKAVQIAEGLDGPMAGRLLANRVFTNPAGIPADLAGYKVECEFAFRLKDRVPVRERPYTRQETEPLLILHLGIELAGSRYAPDPHRKPTTHEGIADNGTGGAFVFGAGIEDWHSVAFESLPIDARIDGGEAIEVYRGIYRRDAADVVVETVNDLCARRIGLNAGDYVATGSLTLPTPIQNGQTVRARFGDLGEVSLTVG